MSRLWFANSFSLKMVLIARSRHVSNQQTVMHRIEFKSNSSRQNDHGNDNLICNNIVHNNLKPKLKLNDDESAIRYLMSYRIQDYAGYNPEQVIMKVISLLSSVNLGIDLFFSCQMNKDYTYKYFNYLFNTKKDLFFFTSPPTFLFPSFKNYKSALS